MPRKRDLMPLLALAALTLPAICRAQSTVTVPASSIATGKPLWVASQGDKSVIDALVDIGTIQQFGDELQVSIRWPYLPASYGPEPAEQDRIVCQSDQALSFDITNGYIGPDGQYHITTTKDPVTARKKEEQYNAQMGSLGGFMSYGQDPRSMPCWAIARKCEAKSFTWPPPPNNTPLENTPQALKMNDDYNKTFIPTWRLN